MKINSRKIIGNTSTGFTRKLAKKFEKIENFNLEKRVKEKMDDLRNPAPEIRVQTIAYLQSMLWRGTLKTDKWLGLTEQETKSRDERIKELILIPLLKALSDKSLEVRLQATRALREIFSKN